MEQVYQNSPYITDGRFEFGKNWTRFLKQISDIKIQAARKSIAAKLDVSNLEGLSFLDVGCGSGLFSLAAHQLGAKVLSFDYDPYSVSCTQELRRRFAQGDAEWAINQGSVLDLNYLQSLGTFDVVYSWGVLHHTGAMWQALENVISLVKPGGRLFIAIYNDAGSSTRRWQKIKRLYNTAAPLRGPVLAACGAYYATARVASYIAHPGILFKPRKRERGMSVVTDFVDWVGGYPFEFATPEEIFKFYQKRGFCLTGLQTRLGNACNEFVMRRHG